MYSKRMLVMTFAFCSSKIPFVSTSRLNYQFLNLIHAVFVNGTIIVCASHTTDYHLDFTRRFFSKSKFVNLAKEQKIVSEIFVKLYLINYIII